jgi:AraC-like DNA-binding protein
MTAQKRASSRRAVPTLPAPVRLPADFPFLRFAQEHPDRPITTLHRHDRLELGFCHAGSGIFQVEDRQLPFAAGCATVIGPGGRHLAQSTPGTTSRWTWIYLDPPALISSLDERDLLDPAPFSGPDWPTVFASGDGIAALIGQLAVPEDGPGARTEVRGLVQVLLARLHRLPGRDREAGRRSRTTRIAGAVDLVARRWRDAIGSADLAAAAGLSPAQLRRHFTAATGAGPLRFLIRHRLQQAARILREDPAAGILDTALACGFGSLAAFDRHFRAEFGSSPRRWRVQARP